MNKQSTKNEGVKRRKECDPLNRVPDSTLAALIIRIIDAAHSFIKQSYT